MTATAPSPWRLCLAPMMRRTDRHFRHLVRLIAPSMRLYSEMVVTGAILHGDRSRFLEFDAIEHPVALQLGGSDPDELAQAAAIAADWGYDEVNLNCGCPSDRVQAGAFGACLMREPQRVATCVSAMRDALPAAVAVSVKTRLGVDDLYDYGYFRDFVGMLADAGCGVFQVHARKAWLSGLNPRENREIPPLEYDWVYRLKREMPHLTVVVNGGIGDAAAAAEHWREVDGVMLGRCAYADPYGLVNFERAARAGGSSPSIVEVAERYLDYTETQLARGIYLKHLSRHLVNLFQRCPGAREWRRTLTTAGAAPGAGTGVVRTALARVVAAAGAQAADLAATS